MTRVLADGDSDDDDHSSKSNDDDEGSDPTFNLPSSGLEGDAGGVLAAPTIASGEKGSAGGIGSSGKGGNREGSGRRKGKQAVDTVVKKKKNIKGKQRRVSAGVDSDDGELTDDDDLILEKKLEVARELGIDVGEVTEEMLKDASSVFVGGEDEPDLAELDNLSGLQWGSVVEGEDYHFLHEPTFDGRSTPTTDQAVIGALPILPLFFLWYLCVVLACLMLCLWLACCLF